MIDVRDLVPGDAPELLSLVRGFFRLHREFLGGRDLLADAEAEEILFGIDFKTI